MSHSVYIRVEDGTAESSLTLNSAMLHDRYWANVKLYSATKLICTDDIVSIDLNISVLIRRNPFKRR